ncbi:orotate phosphoribosyltransferase [Candidatus Bipolaricaulota bacterium]|nr:orotate phosphoribosyltransferase [Candidatus Bipolaricaulota bacterium]
MGKEVNSIESRSRELAPLLWDSNCLDFGEFTLTSGKKSPYYVDLRLLPSHPELFSRATDLAAELIEAKSEKLDSICAVPTGGLPFGTLLAQRTGKPLTYVRKKSKSHGEGRKIEGEMDEGDVLLLVDDIITTGGSVISAANSVRESGGEVNQVAVLVDRTEGGARNLEKEGIELLKLANIEPIVEELGRLERISDEMVEKVKNYLKKR